MLRPLLFFEDTKVILNFFINRNWKKLTDSRKRANILADNSKSHRHPWGGGPEGGGGEGKLRFNFMECFSCSFPRLKQLNNR